MSKNVLAEAARQSLRILCWQLGCIAAISLMIAALFGARAGWSAAAGGSIGAVWTVYMAATLFRHSLNHGRQMGALTFVTGWLVKVGVTLALLVAAFRSNLFAPLPLLCGLFGAMLAYWARLAFGSSTPRS